MKSAEEYHPSLFSREQESVIETKQESVIPQTTLYDTAIQAHSIPAKKHLVVFGFSSSNKKHILEHVQRHCDNFKKEEGKNFIKIWSDDMASLDEILKLNHKLVNGEIIGVYKQNYGVIQDNEIYAKQPGIFKVISEYLFG